MKPEDKQLLFQALCGYLPYNIFVKTKQCDHIELKYLSLDKLPESKPYLRPMASITKDGRKFTEDGEEV